MTIKIKNYFDGKIFTVTPEFIDFREYHINTLNPKNRSPEEFIMDCDALFFEWNILESKLVSPPKNWRHDFIYENSKIDAKKVTTANFNVKNKIKFDQYVDSIQSGELDYFLFYREKYSYDRPMITGDIQEFSIISIVPARTVIKNLSRSDFEGWYYNPIPDED